MALAARRLGPFASRALTLVRVRHRHPSGQRRDRLSDLVLVPFRAAGDPPFGLRIRLPMMADHDVCMIRVGISSMNAVLRNKAVMVMWAAVIVAPSVIGFATVLLGLGPIMPWLAYAAWHAYRETLDASEWPPLQ
jgi:hypothetical protein